jgi:hypothetical protein
METTTKFWLNQELIHSMDAYIPWMPEGSTLTLPFGGATQNFAVSRYHTTITSYEITIHIALK